MSLLEDMPHQCTIRRMIARKDSMGGKKSAYSDEQTGVMCWEQQASASEIKDYEKKGMTIDRKIFFPTDPGVTSRHQIVITARRINGVVTSIAEEDQIPLDVKSTTKPDASAGLGVLYKVMANENTGSMN